MMYRTAIAGLTLCLLAGCVKEERKDCPCYLTLDLDAVIREREFSEAVTSFSPCMNGPVDRDLIILREYEEVGYEKMVMREMVSVSVVCGQKDAVFDGDCLRVTKNAQADPVMAYAENVLCDAERVKAEVTLHKQYCRINFLRNGVDPGEKYPYGMRVTAACNAMNIYDLTPVEGLFIADAIVGDDGNPYVVLPRQKQNALRLDIMDIDGRVLHSIDLGEVFREMSYDWGKEDLDDVNLKIDYTKAEVEIGIVPWETNYETIDI
ncbi:MAG: hypothetical protein MJY89_00495 [Bacteroidales bacterium]|nr:hypothetical protein [Bacteroidales bacterium]